MCKLCFSRRMASLYKLGRKGKLGSRKNNIEG